MKRDTTSKSLPMSARAIEAAVARAPGRVDDPECSYDPNDPAAVADFEAFRQ